MASAVGLERPRHFPRSFQVEVIGVFRGEEYVFSLCKALPRGGLQSRTCVRVMMCVYSVGVDVLVFVRTGGGVRVDMEPDLICGLLLVGDVFLIHILARAMQRPSLPAEAPPGLCLHRKPYLVHVYKRVEEVLRRPAALEIAVPARRKGA